MTYSELDKWRKYSPFLIFEICAIPWFLITRGLADAKLAIEIISPAISFIGALLYIGADLGRKRWKDELDAHVHKQIDEGILSMIPADLAVTDNERRELQPEVIKTLTGVFWDAVNRNEGLRSLKEHFYSNGAYYSTSIDVYVIFVFSGLVYSIVSLVTKEPKFAYAAAGLILIALVCKLLVNPSRRARHLALSAEQLEKLRREEATFVSDRFREIVLNWRRARIMP